MTETQVIFRIDEKLLKRLDSALKVSGFKTRNEWFRHEIRDFLEEIERKHALNLVDKLTIPGISEEDVALMVKEWHEKHKVK